MPPLKPSDRIVQVKSRPGTSFRLQKSGGENSRLQHVDLAAGEYRLDASFLVENSKLMEPITYSDYLLHDGPPCDTVSITVDAEVYAKIKGHMARLNCNTANEALRQLLKLWS
jgi:hypothetical protein